MNCFDAWLTEEITGSFAMHKSAELHLPSDIL